ncbi:MAG: hypothetical protein WC756_03540 [Taibaiella sp.]|jgi:hypothetical protein
MASPLEIVEVKKSFRDKVKKKVSRTAGKKRLKESLNVSYGTIGRLINPGIVRLSTLQLFVAYLEGPDAQVEEYISKD